MTAPQRKSARRDIIVGLEYRDVAHYLRRELRSLDDLRAQLGIAI